MSESSAVPVSKQKGLPKSDKAERLNTNRNKTYSVPMSGPAKHSHSTLGQVAGKPEEKAEQGSSFAGYSSTAKFNGVATAIENGKLSAAKNNLEMLKKAKKSTDCTAYSAKRGVSALQTYFEKEKMKARKGNTQQ
ncbi:hypothetical protein EWM64_g5755 [Hericium alpestre]|uniref:Uncharacterized protein n=1 Tax=Hericium alpestre TaxID=135208 RepID=A0A4Y9ZW16_9AGAM|nr:hypothetical protein EWM64_g5755 [Hericium alpestre]